MIAWPEEVEVAGFRDQVIVITGASSGIGRALALQLAGQGTRLALAARRAGSLEAVAQECRQAGAHAVAVPTDVSRQEQCRALAERTVSHYGRIDMLINDAGVSGPSLAFAEMKDLALLEESLRINCLGAAYCTYYALPYLKQSRGRIVGVSSLAGRSGIPNRSAYSASKHAMTGFFDSLRIELVDTGVSVTMIYPDYVADKDAEVPRGTLTYDKAASMILAAAAARKRELITSGRGKLAIWIKLFAPDVLDRFTRQAASKYE
jgi:NAD(P)-dependent dehydrogenase (short-subunit alcohol dehydrogenase family)